MKPIKLFFVVSFFFTINAPAVLLPVEPDLLGTFDTIFPAFAVIPVIKGNADCFANGFSHGMDDIVFLMLAVQQSRGEVIEFAAFGKQGR